MRDLATGSTDIATFEQRKVDKENAEVGTLSGIDCPICKNKGYYMELRAGEAVQITCRCMKTRNSIKRIKESGLSEALKRLSFDNFKAESEWQSELLGIAKRFADNGEGEWLFIGGQPGIGKTHLCTAIVGRYLDRGYSARYMLWRDDSVRLKSLVNDAYAYAEAINDFKQTDILYIDDFFKTQKGISPTAADINLAFELLNYRYVKNLTTIFSTEKSIAQILDIDEAIGSRIYSKSKNFCQNIAPDKKKNYRLGGLK